MLDIDRLNSVMNGENNHRRGGKINPGDFEDINDSIGLALYGADNKL